MSEQYCKVEHAYDKENDDELNLKEGDIIRIITEEDEGWWEGQIYPDGKSGWLPSNFVVKCDPPKETAGAEKKPAKKNSNMPFGAMAMPGMGVPGAMPGLRKAPQYGITKEYAKTLYDYEPENDDELRIKVGDMIEVTKKEDDGWWEGILNGTSGCFPSNFVELVEDNTLPAKKVVPMKGGIGAAVMGAMNSGMAQAKGPEMCEVLHEYAAENDDELTLKVGDLIEITTKEGDEGWWEGKVKGTSITGVFPNNFVEIIKDGNKATPSSVAIGPGMLRKSRKAKETQEEKPKFVAGPSMLRKRTAPESGSKPFVPNNGPAAVKKPGPVSKPVPPGTSGPSKTAPSGTSGPSKPTPPGTSGPSKPAPSGTSGPSKTAPSGTSGPSKPAPSGTSGPSKAMASSAPWKAYGSKNLEKPEKPKASVEVGTSGSSVSAPVDNADVTLLKKEITELKAQLSEVTVLQREVMELKAQLSDANAQMAEAQSQIKSLNESYTEIQNIGSEVKTVKISIGKAISGFQKDIREARDARLQLSDQLADVKTKVEYGV